MIANWEAGFKNNPSYLIQIFKSIVLNKQDLKVKTTFNRGNNYLAPILGVFKYLYTTFGVSQLAQQ